MSKYTCLIPKLGSSGKPARRMQSSTPRNNPKSLATERKCPEKNPNNTSELKDRLHGIYLGLKASCRNPDISPKNEPITPRVRLKLTDRLNGKRNEEKRNMHIGTPRNSERRTQQVVSSATESEGSYYYNNPSLRKKEELDRISYSSRDSKFYSHIDKYYLNKEDLTPKQSRKSRKSFSQKSTVIINTLCETNSKPALQSPSPQYSKRKVPSTITNRDFERISPNKATPLYFKNNLP